MERCHRPSFLPASTANETNFRSRRSGRLSGMARKLRIAVSVFFGVLTVAIVALWVRSHYRGDTVVLGISDHRGFLADSSSGVLFVQYLHAFGSETSTPKVQLSKWWVGSDQPGGFVTDWGFSAKPFQFKRYAASGNAYITFPHLLLACTSGAAAVVSWLQLRFSLRTLLIATTLVAVVLGLAVWAGR